MWAVSPKGEAIAGYDSSMGMKTRGVVPDPNKPSKNWEALTYCRDTGAYNTLIAVCRANACSYAGSLTNAEEVTQGPAS